MDVYDIFNEKLKALSTDLVNICPEVPDFMMLRNAINLSMSVDRKLLQQYFAKYIAAPYGDFIRQQNEDFFLCHNYEHVDVANDVVEKIKLVWSSLDEHNKNTIWKYFHVLLVLSNACA